MTNEDSPASVLSGFQTEFLARPMGPVGIVLFGLFFVVLSVIAVQLLVGIWPGIEGGLHVLWIPVVDQVRADDNSRLLLIAVFSGALGAFVHAATSFSVFLGNRELKRSWAGWYLLRPFVGMALAVVFYFLVRAGLVAPVAADGSAVSPFGIAAISGLAGMFSKEATDKLQHVFEELLKPPEEEEELRGDKLRGDKLKGAEERPSVGSSGGAAETRGRPGAGRSDT